jgi:O-antigen ligase
MESAVFRAEHRWPRLVIRLGWSQVSIWLLAGGLVLYLAFAGGGYDIVIHSQASILVWWIVLLGAAWGLLPAGRPSRLALIGLALLGAFVGWTALGVTWSLSSERSLSDLSLVCGYLGVLVLGVMLCPERETALRHTIGAVAGAVVVVAAVAVASRLHPGLIPASGQTSSLLTNTQQRLAWPLNYWNALAALLVLGLPLLLGLADSARTLKVQAAAAGAIPLVILCGYLTFSRAGALAAAVALIAFLALASERLPKLATVLTSAVGSVVLIASVAHRSALEHGLTTAAATHQGSTLIAPILLVCAGVATAQVGLSLAARHATPPRWLSPSPRRARQLLAGAAAILVGVALAAGAPGMLSRAWRDFKQTSAPALHDYSLGRFASVSGHGRYDYWRVAIDSTHGHLLQGSGPGTFQLLWLPHAPFYSYVQNAHSLYVETLAELGLVGLCLLVAFFVLVLGAAIRLVLRSQHESRTRAAAAAAALLAFMVSCAFDWYWQVPVLPVVFVLISAAVLAPSGGEAASRRDVVHPGTLRLLMVEVAVACLIAVAIPLATTNAVRASQAASSRGQLAVALRDAEEASRVEPGAASAQIQVALVQELRGDLPAALAAAREAAADEPENWSIWLVLSRLEAKTSHPRSSLVDYERARSLNPRSPLFAQ